MSVLCSPMERGSLAKGQSQGINSVVKYLLPGIELENKYILISDFCVEFFFFSFILLFFKKFPRITFKKINCWAKLTVGLLACKYQCDNLDLEWFVTTKGWGVHLFGQFYSTDILLSAFSVLCEWRRCSKQHFLLSKSFRSILFPSVFFHLLFFLSLILWFLSHSLFCIYIGFCFVVTMTLT